MRKACLPLIQVSVSPKGDEILVEGAIGVAAAVGESREGVAEVDCGMAVGREREWAGGGAVGVDVGLAETDGGEKAVERGVAVLEEILAIEAATDFVDEIGENERV